MKGMEKMMWGGRFDKKPISEVLKFNSAENIELDQHLIFYDAVGSIAHVKMLGKTGIIKKEECEDITRALISFIKSTNEKTGALKLEYEDVHMNVEVAVTAITPHGKKMHTARSRNDQVLLDMRMYMRSNIIALGKSIVELQKSFETLAKKDGVMVAYTHTRVAQPITLSFWSDSVVKSLYRDLERLLQAYKRVNQNPLGAGAIAGTSWPIDRNYTAKLLGFEGVQENELDTINSRGECESEILAIVSILMNKVSGIAEELIWLSQKGLVQIPAEFCTGSSMMPNKKNPDVLEIIRGRTVRVQSNFYHALGVKKGLMTGYNSDLQETKYAIMSGIQTTIGCLDILQKLIPDLVFDQKEIATELEKGYAQATEIADSLARKGVPFREAHERVGKLVKDCEGQGIGLSNTAAFPEFSRKEWEDAVSLKRSRLERKVVVDKGYGKMLDDEEARIEKAYQNLIAK